MDTPHDFLVDSIAASLGVPAPSLNDLFGFRPAARYDFAVASKLAADDKEKTLRGE